MNERIQQLTYIDNKVEGISPKNRVPSKSDIAIIIHIFYIDIWKEIHNYLTQLQTPYDLYITFPEEIPNIELVQIFKDAPHVQLFKTQNHGRDVLPFLLVMNLIGTEKYPYICKLHTKKTGNSPLGNVWRKLLYFDLIGSDTIVKNTLKLFQADSDIGMITGKNTILDSERYNYGNTTKIDRLIDDAGFLFQDEYYFAGGTMFWARSELLEPLLTLFQAGKLVFEEEKGQKDNTLAHAIERFFGIICQVKGKKIIPSLSHYSNLDDSTLDEVASLVLSQQYHGKDVFLTQNKHILMQQKEMHKLHQRIDELTELADLKKRFKNILKQYIPTIAIRMIKNTKKAIMLLKHNPQVLKKVFFYLKRGDISYLIQKIKEKSQKNINESAQLIKIDPQLYFKRFKKKNFSLGDISIDIIIPVYNGYEYLKPLFDSIEKYTTSPHRLIVINDCSPDKRVKAYLTERLANHPTAIFIDHDTNQGFVKSVNEAYNHISNHFLILNTDTELPAFWLERLMYPIVYMEKIASTTPFTNAGQIASFPNFIADNDIFEGMNVEALDRAFRNINPEPFYEEVPTGVGFCMGINYHLTEEIGFFSEDVFGKGYGEENDWCQRAIQHNYKNLMVPNLFVYHKHGGSFSAEEKAKLMKENAVKLLNKYPNYDKDVSKYVQRDPHATLRNILIVIASSKNNEGMHLIVDHALGGGANVYANTLIETYKRDLKKVLYMTYDFYSNQYNFYFHYKQYAFEFSIDTIDGVERFLEELTLEEIFVNSLVSFTETNRMLNIIKTFQEIYHSKLVVPIHDYYPVCPNFTLLNEKSEFCEIPSLERCNTCMRHNHLEWRTFGNDTLPVKMWREKWEAVLHESTKIICFSNSSKTILLRAYPTLDKKKITVVPHKVTPLLPVTNIQKQSTDTLTIGVLGAINLAKGAEIISNLVKTIERNKLNINIVLIGEISMYIKSKHFKATGRYERDALPELVTNYGIDMFFIPSICPETFSYTTQEIIMMEMPLMVFNLGAPAERVAAYDKGYIIEHVSVESVLETIQKIENVHCK